MGYELPFIGAYLEYIESPPLLLAFKYVGTVQKVKTDHNKE
jgi:hypothetical protein